MATREQLIVEIWQRLGKEVVGASELGLIHDALAKHFGSAASLSPASIARVLAEHGARLGHPEVLQADTRWREQHFFFAADDLGFDSLEAATALIEKIKNLTKQFDNDDRALERLRQSVRQLKTDLDSVAASEKAGLKRRELAEEVANWLTLWLQNPQIFPEWLALRRDTSEFRERFHS